MTRTVFQKITKEARRLVTALNRRRKKIAWQLKKRNPDFKIICHEPYTHTLSMSRELPITPASTLIQYEIIPKAPRDYDTGFNGRNGVDEGVSQGNSIPNKGTQGDSTNVRPSPTSRMM